VREHFARPAALISFFRVQERDDISGLLYLLAEFSIFVAPLGAALLRPKFQASSRRGLRTLTAIAMVFITGDAIILVSSWSLRGLLPDAVFVVFSYFAYCALIIAISTLKPRWFTFPLTVLGIVPMVAGFVLGTVGILGILMVLGDVTPAREGKLGARMSYRVRYHGGATESHNESTVAIVRSPALFPFIEKEIFYKDYLDSDCDLDLVSARIGPDRETIEITCGRGVLDTTPYSK
jgi:hypothetical protein